MDDAALWEEFLSYLRRARVASGPVQLFEGYRHELRGGSCEDFEYGVARWDLVVMTYVTFEVASPLFAARIVEALRPGGVVVLESGATHPHGPGGNRVLVDPDEVRSAYGALTELVLKQSTAMSDWGLRPLPIVRLAARRDSRPTPAARPA